MSKLTRITKINARLRRALREYHATSNISQEELAARMNITPRACSALENGKSGFSTISVFMLFSLLSKKKRLVLFKELCIIVMRPSENAA